MTRAALETQVLAELRHLSLEQAQEALDFVLFLRSRLRHHDDQPQRRPLGLMQGKASCQFADDFEISDEELLRS